MSILRRLALFSALLYPLLVCADVSLPGLGLVPPARGAPPPYSSVMFSTRFERPEALAVASEFHATHFAWLYPKTRSYIDDLKTHGLSVGTTLNANQPVPEEGLARDLEGKPLVAPWMQSWGARWISVSSPATRTALLDAAQRHIAWGAEAIQFDDPALATASFNWGGDFSSAALKNFGAWLASPAAANLPDLPGEARSGQFDYHTWLTAHHIETTSAYLSQRSKLPLNAAWERFHLDEVRDFFTVLRDTLHARSRPVSLDLNLTNPRPDARTFQLIDLADGVMSETSASDLANTALGAATVQGAGATYLPSLQPHDVAATRRQIAAFYALGALPLVPWDVYMPDLIDSNRQRTPQPRYFGTPAEYADLYRFVRSQPALFDGKQGAASVLLLCQVENFRAAEVLDIVRKLQARHIPFALMVARTGYPARAFDAERISRAAAVIHASAFTNLDAASIAALKAAEAKRIRPEDIEAQSARLAPVEVEGSLKVLAQVRIDPAHPHDLIVHLVRAQSGGPESATLALRLNPSFMPAHKITGAELFTPTHPVAQRISTSPLAFSVPFEGDWAVLHIQID